jgi:hypothetical protein
MSLSNIDIKLPKTLSIRPSIVLLLMFKCTKLATNPLHWTSLNYCSSANLDGCLRPRLPALFITSTPTRRPSPPIAKSIARHSHSYSFPHRNRCIAMANPIVRDFQATRQRSATQSNLPAQRFSLEVDPSKPRRYNTSSTTAGFYKHRDSSLDDGAGIRRRLSRHATIRTYHSPTRQTWEEPGAEPGVDTSKDAEPRYQHLTAVCQITVVDYSAERMEKYELDNASIEDFLVQPRPEWVSVRWVNVNGLSWDVIQACGNAFDLHRLAIEDLMNPRGRSKVDWYSNQAYSK